MSYCILDSKEIAKEILKDYTDADGNVDDVLVNMVNSYLFNSSDMDFYHEVMNRLDMEYFAEQVANEMMNPRGNIDLF